MPPKKKGHQSSKAASAPSGDVVEPTVAETPALTKADYGKNKTEKDAWTDEQEISLFKGMIRWKPVGIHKHFRMIAISENLKNHGYASPQNSHTRIQGIWEKLNNLYNLEALGARENHGDPIPTTDDPTKEPFCPFALPDEDYRELMFARRLAPEGTPSPPTLPHQLSGFPVEYGISSHDTVDDPDDPRSSPASIGGQKTSRTTRASKGTRTSQLAEVSTMSERRGSRGSVDQATEGDRKEEDEGDGMDEDEDDGKAITVKETSKVSKAAAARNTARRSGRKR